MAKFIPLEGIGEAKDDSNKEHRTRSDEEKTETKKSVRQELSDGVSARRKNMAAKMGKHKGGGSGKEPKSAKRLANKPHFNQKD